MGGPVAEAAYSRLVKNRKFLSCERRPRTLRQESYP